MPKYTLVVSSLFLYIIQFGHSGSFLELQAMSIDQHGERKTSH